MRRTDAVFFLSGLAALVYETIWARLLTRLLGSQASATAVVLAVFMAGLGIGALLFASRARSTERPQRMYALLEGFIGVWAALSPAIFAVLEPVDSYLARAVVASVVLLPPTIAMGATFPLMGRLTIASAEGVGTETSSFYGANTLGACAGAVLGTAVFMPVLGLRGGLWGAAACSFLAAWLGSTLGAPAEREQTVGGGKLGFDAFWTVPMLLGMSSLALEVILTRLLVTVTGASIYAFAIVLAVFLFGIGLGSRQARELLTSAERSKRVVSISAVLVPVLSLVGVLALRWQLSEPDLFASLANRMPSNVSPIVMWLSHALFAGLALLPPAVAFGMALPASVAVAVARAPAAARERTLGAVYAANTLGALLGSLGAAFLAMPMLGLRVGYAIALAPCALAALLADGFAPRTPRGVTTIGIAAAAALAVLALRPAERPDGARVLLHEAGLYEMVAVEESVEPDGTPVRSIRLNGKVEASTAAVDQRLQLLLGHIPGLLHGHVVNALCIGTGTGMTAGSLLDLPALEHLTLFEIEPVVPNGTRMFGEWNNHLLDDPRLKIVFGDGRHSLFETDARFDLITADPLHVWSRGSSDLYTLEYYREMAHHLAPRGVASQWIGLYELSTRDVKTVISTWCAAFPHTTAYLTAYDLALVGSNDPIATDLSAVALPPRMAEHLARVGVHSGAEIAALCVGDDADLRSYSSDVPAMRDDLPILEFRAPFSFLKGYSEEVLRWCARPEFVERLPASSRERARQIRQLLTKFLDELGSGMSAASARYGHELLALPPLGA